VINLSYFLGSEHAPRTAMKLKGEMVDKGRVWAFVAPASIQHHFGDRSVWPMRHRRMGRLVTHS